MWLQVHLDQNFDTSSKKREKKCTIYFFQVQVHLHAADAVCAFMRLKDASVSLNCTVCKDTCVILCLVYKMCVFVCDSCGGPQSASGWLCFGETMLERCEAITQTQTHNLPASVCVFSNISHLPVCTCPHDGVCVYFSLSGLVHVRYIPVSSWLAEIASLGPGSAYGSGW